MSELNSLIILKMKLNSIASWKRFFMSLSKYCKFNIKSLIISSLFSVLLCLILNLAFFNVNYFLLNYMLTTYLLLMKTKKILKNLKKLLIDDFTC